jgi:agmatine deiminase
MIDEYYMPAEWSDHQRCWMAWPCRDGLWVNPEETCKTYAAVAHAIRDFEPLRMLVPPHLVDQAYKFLGSDIEVIEMPIDDSWSRDSGPNFVKNKQGKLAGVCFRFNAWGKKYEIYDQDAQMAERILLNAKVPIIKSDLIAEGGGICVDGEGTLLTTDTCFTNKNRNPAWSREEIEQELKRLLGVRKVIWLPGDPLDKETDGHIDGIAAFASPGRIILETSADCNDPRKPFFDSLKKQLMQETDAHGRSFELLELPEATEECTIGEKFCLSYVNFYIANGGVIAPSYGIKTDEEVKEKLQSYFPDKKIVMVPISSIAEGGGGIHCITQQQPS